MPEDATGVGVIGPILFTPRGDAYAYWYNRFQGDLYLVAGLK